MEFPSPPRVVAFDPGSARTGVATWDHDYKPTAAFIVDQERLDEILPDLAVADVFVIEEYRVNNQQFNHQGSKVETVQVIGAIKYIARKYKIKVVEIGRDRKKIAAKWAQVKVPRGHMPDDMAAYLIGYYYLRSNDLIKSKLLERKHV